MARVAGERAAEEGTVEAATDEASRTVQPRGLSKTVRTAGQQLCRVRPRQLDGVLAVAVVVGAGLRLWGIGDQSLWYDEWLTAKAASGSLPDLTRHITRSEGIPPTYFGVMWIWARVVGDGDAALRACSALAGIATIPMAYAVAVEMRQRLLVARSAALLVAVNPMLVWYSQEARPYSLVAFLGGLSLWALTRAWTRERRTDLAVWTLVAAITVAVHYVAVFLIAVEGLALLVAKRRQAGRLLEDWRQQRLDRREWLSPFVPTGLVLAGLAPFAAGQQLKGGAPLGWIDDFSLTGRLHGLGTAVLVGPSPPSWAWVDGWVWLVGAGAVVLAAVLLLTLGDRTGRLAAGGAGALALATVALALAATVVGVDTIIERYLIVLMVPLVVAVATGLGASRVPSWLTGMGVTAACIVSAVVPLAVIDEPHLQRADWRAVATAHDAVESGGTRLLVVNTHGYLGLPLQRYLNDAERLDHDETITVDRIDFVVGLPSDQPCNGFIGLPCSMLFLGVPGHTMILGPLAAHFQLDERVELDQFAVERYVAPAPVRLEPQDIVARRPDGKWPGLVLATD